MRGSRAALLAGVSLVALASPAAAYNDPQTGVILNDASNREYAVSTSELDSTTTTPAVITGLSIPLTAGKTYSCLGHVVLTNPNTTAGAKVALVASAGLSATSMSYSVLGYNGTTLNVNPAAATSLGTYEGSGALYTDFYITGSIVVNAGGTINVYGEQNAQYTTTATKFLINSNLSCVRVN
jgi:hypothetical protein